MDHRTPSRFLYRIRHRVRSSEAAIILLAVIAGLAAGALTTLQSTIARLLQTLLYGLDVERLSAVGSIEPVRLLALPAGGLVLALISRATRTRPTPIDVVEANALHGGVIPAKDSLLVSAQTIISNGFGASVGLEAAYAQIGGGLASGIGKWFKLRRADLRILVGAGAGAAIGAAFGAPLTGAFYAFEIVIGAYTPAAIAPVAAAALAAVIVVRTLAIPTYLVALPSAQALLTSDYFLFAGLGIVCSVIAIAFMRAVAAVERIVRSSALPVPWRPVIGGALLMPIALLSPQALSAGHGALHLDLTMQVSVAFLCTILVLKMAASTISLGFGFRGGLFFASLFLGSLIGQIYAVLLSYVPGVAAPDATDAALIGMTALAVAVVGGPMTMSMLVLETTHDFALTGVAITASLCASTIVRESFGFSFSTWRLHMRGETIRSARDVGWARALTAGKMMRKDVPTVDQSTTIGEFQRRFPLGSTGRVLLIDRSGCFAGMLITASAHAPGLSADASILTLVEEAGVALTPDQDVQSVMNAFDRSEADYLAVVDADGRVMGSVSERFVHRRYAEEIEKSQRELFGERT